LNLSDQLLRAGMLYFGFVEQIVVIDCFARSRIKNLFLNLRMDRQSLAYLFGKRLLLGVRVPVILRRRTGAMAPGKIRDLTCINTFSGLHPLRASCLRIYPNWRDF
jgi:hypothetical protein